MKSTPDVVSVYAHSVFFFYQSLKTRGIGSNFEFGLQNCKYLKEIIYVSLLKFVLQKAKVPKFKITGKIDSLMCNITDPFTGEVSAGSIYVVLTCFKFVFYELKS